MAKISNICWFQQGKAILSHPFQQDLRSLSPRKLARWKKETIYEQEFVVIMLRYIYVYFFQFNYQTNSEQISTINSETKSSGFGE